jgi:ABC-2 type transport system permease protein
MSADVALLDLRWRRRSLIGYPIGLAVYAITVIAIYPSFAHDESLDSLTENSKFAALFGASGPLTTPSGWLNANLYANFVPLVVLLVAIGYGASALAGQNEDGILGLVGTLPVSRRSLVLQKFGALCALIAPVSAATFVCVLAGRAFQLPVDIAVLVEISVGVVLLGAVFGALALVLGALTGSRGTALGVTSGIAAVAYLISSLAPVVPAVHAIRFISPFYWSVGAGQISTGLGWGNAVALVVTAAALLAVAILATERMDVR